MIALFLSIILTAAIFIIFKLFEKFKVDTFSAVIVNYGTAGLLGLLFNLEHIPILVEGRSWLSLAIGLGLLFIVIFSLMAYTAQKIGVSVSSVANKMSMVIPVLFSVYLYNDKLNLMKITGLILAIVSVILSSLRENDKDKNFSFLTILLPVVLFISSGILDSLLNFAQKIYLGESHYGIFSTTIFCSAFIIGLLWNIIYKRHSINRKSLIAGMILGLVNYFSVFFFLHGLNQFDSSVFFPMNNIGIVSLSTLTAFFIFKEKLSYLNWSGIMLSIVTILIISFS